MRVLIVGKTKMYTKVCVGGIELTTKRSVRLLTQFGDNHPQNTPFDIGQIWEMEYIPLPAPFPPHVEDVTIIHSQLVDTITNMRETLLSLITPWKGGIQSTFDGKLQFTPNGSAYIARSGGIPSCSTGFWLLDQQLNQQAINDRIRFTYLGILESCSLPFVGFAQMPPVIPPNSLVRLSLARWWSHEAGGEERCYLQLSGWFQ